jgi:hypothetical protein
MKVSYALQYVDRSSSYEVYKLHTDLNTGTVQRIHKLQATVKLNLSRKRRRRRGLHSARKEE